MDSELFGSRVIDKNVEIVSSQTSDRLLSSTSTSLGPRLTVPTSVSLTDKTPTPTKLLQGIDDIGLFQDEDDDEEHRQKKVEELKDRLVGNPFDEHFRKATQMQKDGAAASSANECHQKQDEVLNTPQIITSEYPTPSVLLTSEISPGKKFISSRSNSLISVKASRPILPASSYPAQQLILRWPVGGDELSNSNFTGIQDKSQSPAKRTAQDEAKQSSKKRKDSGGNDSDDRKREMLERNRAAASRSRRRKKDQIKNVQELNSKLATSNKALIQENKLLKEENSKLKEALLSHKYCSISLANDGQKIASNNSFQNLLTHGQVRPQQVKIIPVNPKDFLRIQDEQRQQQQQNQTFLFQSQNRILPETPVYLVKPTDIVFSGSGQRDILQEATEHILRRDHPSPVKLDVINPGGVVMTSGSSIQHRPSADLVMSSPGFVRVTPNYISVKSPLAKKSQKVKKAL